MTDALRHDLHYALRHLRRSPGFTAAAILTLALGVGANTAMFSMLSALVLRPLPIPDPDGLIGLTSRNAQGQLRLTLISAVESLQQDGPLEPVCGYNGGGVFAVDVNGAPTQTVIALVTGRCFDVFGVPPLLGRTIQESDAPYDRPGNLVAVIGHRFWIRMFGGDPGAVGKRIRMEGVELTVIGVMPEGFGGLQADTGIDVYMPNYTITPRRSERPSGAAQLLGRLKPGRTFESAAAEITTRWPSLLEATAPATLAGPERADFTQSQVRIERMRTGLSFYRDRYARPVTIILGLTMTLLVLACVNLGGLLLARLSARASEISVRLALGGSRARIAQQMMIESVLLSLSGALVGVPVAFAIVGVVSSFVPDPLVARSVTFEPDLRALALTAACGILAGVLMSAVPAMLAWRRHGAVSFGWDRTIAGTTNRWAKGLLVIQVALSVVMLTGAGLLIRSVYLLQHVSRGVTVDRVLNVRIMPLPNAYRTIDNASYYPALLAQLSALPGVRSAGLARVFPRVISEPVGTPISFAGEPLGNVRAQLESASPGFFETVGIQLLQGRRLAWTDHSKSQQVAVVSESLAKQLASDGSVIGRAVNFGTDRLHQNVVIVGVVANASFGNPRYGAIPVFYRPTLQAGLFANYPNLLLAANSDPIALTPSVAQVIKEGGREYAHEIVTLSEVFRRAPSSERMSATLAGALATLAAMLAFIGVYGLLAYTVSRRTREIGVRVALGASRSAVVNMVMREGLALTAIGLTIGVPVAMVAARALRSLMFGLTETDPAVIAVTVIFFAILGMCAGVIPSLRASAVDPLTALRHE